jgi:hypothetical protein
MKSNLLKIICGGILLLSNIALAADISLLESKYGNINKEKVIALIKNKIPQTDVAAIKAQVVFNDQIPDHVIVFKLSNKYLAATVDNISIDQDYNFISLQPNYTITTSDAAQRVLTINDIACPAGAEKTQVIVFAPLEDNKIQQIANSVADTAENTYGLPTKRLLQQNATAQNYLNYMSCPTLIGNFAIATGLPDAIITADGYITATDIDTALLEKFHFSVATIWAVGNVFAGEMGRSLAENAQTQRLTAGLTELSLATAPAAAACTMKAILDGKTKISDTLAGCKKIFRDPNADFWGMEDDGFSSDYFGTPPNK